MNRNSSKHLIIPVEIQSREMLAKLYLGAVAACSGYHVVVGDQKQISRNIHRFHPGIYIDKSVAKTKHRYFKRLIRMGFTPVAVCEEGLVYRNRERYLKERIDSGTYALCRFFYCWGHQQRDDIKSHVTAPGKLIPTGNPRFDLLRMEFRSIWHHEQERIKQQYGRYLLINTNFSRFNRLPGTPDVIELLKKRKTLDAIEGPKYYDGLVNHLKGLMHKFIDAIPEVATAFPRHNIIIRPHPGENSRTYQKLSQKCGNIDIVSNGSVVPWLLSADAIIHNSCTTGVEGWLLGRPVISFMPLIDDRFDSYLPNALSYRCRDNRQLTDTIDEILSNDIGAKDDIKTLDIVRHYITGSKQKMAADRLLRHLPDAGERRNGYLALKETGHFMLKNILRKLLALKTAGGYKRLAKQKFPGMQISEAEFFLDQLAKCRPELEQITIKQDSLENVFHISLGMMN
jgi:surface carbohydrate biosynthesis protein